VDADDVLGDNVPEAVRDVWTHFGGMTKPRNLDAQTKKVYEIGQQGKCMLCHRKVGSEAVLKITAAGILEVYCSHTCSTDMIAMGWITEKYDDLSDALKFRAQEPVT
jgi:hypothetical protein